MTSLDLNPRAREAPVRNALSLASVLALSACGGGSETAAPVTVQPAAGFAIVQGKVNDANGSPLNGASVALPFGANQAWAGTTDAQGNFSFQARASDFSGVSPVALVISKSGYRTRTAYFQSIAAGARYDVPANANTSPAALAPGEYVPIGAVGLVHLGDASFGGAANSQLQTGTRGRMADFEVVTWTDALKAAYSQAVVEFQGRGVQGSLCQNQFGLTAFNAVAGTGVPRYVNPGDSDPAGGYSRMTVRVNVADFPVGASIRFVSISGPCATGYDDFEFSEAFVRFER